jgi:antitoxin component YwqK of YwqJK toxin-antitoxin module
MNRYFAVALVLSCAWSNGVLAQGSGTAGPETGTTPASSGAATSSGRSGSPRSVTREAIEPYTGPPIYLEQAAEVAPPTIVTRQTIKDEYEDGKLRVERQVARFSDNHFEADGFYREFYPSGNKFVEGQFLRGRQHGPWTYYHENGKVNRKATYKNGQPDGAWEVFRADGTLAAKRGFREGVRHGNWATYDATGEKQLRQENYDNGKLDGEFKVWFPNGQLRQQITFKQGQPHGLTAEWTDDGKKRGEVTFVDGKRDGTATLWLPDGRKIVQQYEDGRLISESKE